MSEHCLASSKILEVTLIEFILLVRYLKRIQTSTQQSISIVLMFTATNSYKLSKNLSLLLKFILKTNTTLCINYPSIYLSIFGFIFYLSCVSIRFLVQLLLYRHRTCGCSFESTGTAFQLIKPSYLRNCLDFGNQKCLPSQINPYILSCLVVFARSIHEFCDNINGLAYKLILLH